MKTFFTSKKTEATSQNSFVLLHSVFQKLLIIVVAVVIVLGCEGMLDTRLDTDQTEEMVAQNYNVLWNFGFAAYSNVRNGFSVLDNNLFAAATDEAEQTAAQSQAQLFHDGSWNAFNNPADFYEGAYSGIRAANFFLEKSENYREFLALNRDTVTTTGRRNYDQDVEDIGWLRAEARILRAYYHFELAKLYDGVPLITQTLSIDDDSHLPRNSFDEIIDFVVSEIDAVIDDLQPDWSEFDVNRAGRVTQGAALALKSRALLYSASPLHNPTGDLSKWQAAAAAAHEVISLHQYALDNDYRNLFVGNNSSTSPETIWAIRLGSTNEMERRNYPIGTPGGNSGVTPSHNLVAAYETVNPQFPVDPNEYDEDPIVDNLEDWDKIFDRSANTTLFIDDSPNALFDGDLSRAVRTSATNEWIVWHHPSGVETFEMIGWFWPGNDDIHFTIEVSPDASTWTETNPDIEQTFSDWRRYNYTLEGLSNTRYIRVTFNSLDQDWDTQIGQVTLIPPPFDPPPMGPYANRDPRLGYSIATDGSDWNGRSIEIWSGGDDERDRSRASRTGYYLKKFLSPNLDLQRDEARTRSWIIFRYGEILLNYAEAMNEAFGPDNDNGWSLTAREAVNAVRSRPGVEMPDVQAASQTEMRERIKHERRIELAFEGHRYLDLIRWLDAGTVLNQSLQGIRADRDQDGSITYTEFTVEQRVFEAPKMHFFPIPQTEITKSGGVLEQNPGW